MVWSLLLVHSPLVGPSTWAPTASELRSRGIHAIVPDVTPAAAASRPRWETFVDLAARAAADLPGPVAVVGHSGAGPLLPAIGEQLGQRLQALVFVDAVVPASSGVHRTPPHLLAQLDEHVVDGRLERWLDWWPEDVTAELVPDPAQRDSLRREMPRLPRALYDRDLPLPDGWSAWPCAFVRLSEAYDDDLAEASARGWPTVELDATHLSPCTHPTPVASAIGSALDALDVPPHALDLPPRRSTPTDVP